MELREYYKILRKNLSVVIYTVVIVVILAYAWSIKTAQTYNTSLLLNVSRTETQTTTDYRYDQFYRMQADDKFAETIVEWLKSPGIANEIFAKAGISTNQKTMRELSKSFRAEKLSSSIVGINYSTQTSDESSRIAPALQTVISDKVKSMNAEARDPDWFQVDMSNLIILKNAQSLPFNLGVAALIGIFIGTILAFGKFYISDEK